ncbi:AAA family ATPase [Pseudomonas sp. FP2335]|uniref:ATP-dependent nuclease n=1 Tax=Pseudomonas sp. FP2335 TaxID=2954092 RepID=UPI002736E95B|nr:AAA family ATPase [Pseudomonas sp. FP2335]WLH79565.1 AAA family ATPase [Pseudomonas sp. FP2335]
MYIAHVKIENFRLFGADDQAFELSLNPGLTAFVGENDAGKTALVDALRFVLGTRDQESLRLEQTDFHLPSSGEQAKEIKIRLVFLGLTAGDRSAFAEYLTYSNEGSDTVLILTWIARRTEISSSSRRYIPIEWRTGKNGDGPLLDSGARFMLQATYLRPLRDAERAMSAGRGSRLSQILQHTKEIRDHGVRFDLKTMPRPVPEDLSVLGIGDYSSHLIENAHGVKTTREKLNRDYLQPLSFKDDDLAARIRISGHRDDGVRLRQLLEKLEVNLGVGLEDPYLRGLGSNNLLFMACELLLMGTEADGFPLLLIEEPEAHLHPQRQLRLISFLKSQAEKRRLDGQQIQIIVTTHSPNFGADVKLDNLVLIKDGRGFSMAKGNTKLTESDYRFLQRFLDVTKSNLFFARGVVIVEGDAENILMPTLAKLVGRDFEHYGVSIVNVGGVGLGRYGRIFIRETPGVDGELKIPVSCITDMDVMPDCAPHIIGKLELSTPIPPLTVSKRRWRVKSDFPGCKLEEKRSTIRDKANEQWVKTFVADEWTLEYDLAFFGLSEQLFLAAALAKNDDKLNEGAIKRLDVISAARKEYSVLLAKSLSNEELSSTVYAPYTTSAVSKAIAAQYLSEILEDEMRNGLLSVDTLIGQLPPYIKNAIAHVTEQFSITVPPKKSDVTVNQDTPSVSTPTTPASPTVLDGKSA